MKSGSYRKYISTLICVLISTLSLSACMNSGMRFLDDVFSTVCCFSPGLILAGALLLSSISHRK